MAACAWCLYGLLAEVVVEASNLLLIVFVRRATHFFNMIEPEPCGGPCARTGSAHAGLAMSLLDS